MENKTLYHQGSIYEVFMGRAFKTPIRSKSGMHGTTFTNLVDSENGNSNVKHLGSKHKILVDLKKNMHKGMEKYLANKKLPESNRLAIEGLKIRIDRCYYSEDLYDIIEQTIELTQVLNVKNQFV